MKIYTKTGDKGTTSLVGGKRVSKSDVRIEAYGTSDELNSFIGLLRAQNLPQDIDMFLHYLQNKMFNIGSVLATENEKFNYVAELVPMVADVQKIEAEIDNLQQDLPEIKNFILPAGNQRIALCHVCRTICRRLERRMVELQEKLAEKNSEIKWGESLTFVNRMSDFFFILSKKIAKSDHFDIFLWEK